MGDYATCAKVAATCALIQDSPANLQPAILQAILEDTYIDDGGVGASSVQEKLNSFKRRLELYSEKGASPSNPGSTPVKTEQASTWV